MVPTCGEREWAPPCHPSFSVTKSKQLNYRCQAKIGNPRQGKRRWNRMHLPLPTAQWHGHVPAFCSKTGPWINENRERISSKGSKEVMAGAECVFGDGAAGPLRHQDLRPRSFNPLLNIV